MVCKYVVDEFCTNRQCPMHGDCCPVPHTDGVCRYEEREDEPWVLTPKGCFVVAVENYIQVDKDTLELIWHDFEHLMREFNYVKDFDN